MATGRKLSVTEKMSEQDDHRILSVIVPELVARRQEADRCALRRLHSLAEMTAFIIQHCPRLKMKGVIAFFTEEDKSVFYSLIVDKLKEQCNQHAPSGGGDEIYPRMRFM